MDAGWLTFHPRLHEAEGHLDHRMPKHDDPDVRYGLRHSMTFTADGQRGLAVLCVLVALVGIGS